MTKRVYQKELPEALSRALADGMQIAFSEGLLGYFLSRPEIGVNTQFAMRSEGLFACYFNPRGRMSRSSFDPPTEESEADVAADPGWDDDKGVHHKRKPRRDPTVWQMSPQKQWDQERDWGISPNGNDCYNCKFSDRCATPSDHHYLICAFAAHNHIPLKSGSGAIAHDPWAKAGERPISWARLIRKGT